MSNPTWPSTLPAPLADPTAAFSGAQNVIRTTMEAPVAKQRRRFTAVAAPFGCTLKITGTQWETLWTFWTVTLGDVLPFDWTFGGITYTLRPVGQRPARTFVQGSIDRWLVTLQLEVMP